MGKPNAEKELNRIEHMSSGGHLGGTKFGQTPGAASIRRDTHHARPQPTAASARGSK